MNMFRPKIFDTLKNYTRSQFINDLSAGVIVGIVALPLAIAFAIASGVPPEKGLYTAIIAGFIISVLGGSRVQIGGPTGAFVVIVYGIVQQYGLAGLTIATFLAGIMLVLMGIARFGTVIKFIPHPLIVGFTTGIAVIIFSSQVKDLLGLQMGAVPADFLNKWKAYAAHLPTFSVNALMIAVSTIIIILLWPKVTHKIPGSLVAIILTTTVSYFTSMPLETIGTRFGHIASSLPVPAFPHIDWQIVQHMVRPAFAIAMLGSIESLLSAAVADGMIGGNHRSNIELVAQGTANIFSSVFGGIPATGAIARTATNIKNGGRTPVAGIVHAIMLFLIMLFVGKWATLIPMATLAGILAVVAYNMSEWRNFVSITKSFSSDTVLLITTFLLTVLVDLTIAIECGIVLSAFLFMRKMMQFSNVKEYVSGTDEANGTNDEDTIANYVLPKGVIVYEIMGPLFFGAAYKFKDAIRIIDKDPKVLIIRMRHVPIIDATGLRTMEEVIVECKHQKIRLILSEVNSQQVMSELQKARLLFKIGKANVTTTIYNAVERSRNIIAENMVSV